MSGLRVLISGAGIAGPVTAYWLAKAGAQVMVIERAPVLRAGGQNVDIWGHGLSVLRRMGLEQVLYANTTEEAGVKFMKSDNGSAAEFPARDDTSFSAEVEIMRGTVAKLLYEEIKIRLTDGQSSSTRFIVFDDASKHAVKFLGQFMAWFKVPRIDTDDRWAWWYNAPGRRCMFLRPDGRNKDRFVRAVLAVISHEYELRQALEYSETEQKSLWRDLFSDAGWQEDRIHTAMNESNDFYMQEIVQVKLDAWSVGRTVLVGDAAYCASLISGMGTTLAITGAYVLAGEICKHPRNLPAAFKAYEDRMRPFVEKSQSLPPGAPWIANPETSWGISIFYSILGFVAWSGLLGLLRRAGFGAPPATAMDLPDYHM